jgi:hypothetical protein
VRMMCVLELGAPSPKAGSDSDATAHIKRTGALRGSGAEPHVREEGVPYASRKQWSLDAFALPLPSPVR